MIEIIIWLIRLWLDSIISLQPLALAPIVIMVILGIPAWKIKSAMLRIFVVLLPVAYFVVFFVGALIFQ